MTSPLAVCWFWLRLSACLHSGTSPSCTDRDGGGVRRSRTHWDPSSVTGNQAVHHTSPLHYQHVPCCEIYPRTVILWPGTRTRRWLILFWHRLVFYCLSKRYAFSAAPVYCATDLLNHVQSWKRYRMSNQTHRECVGVHRTDHDSYRDAQYSCNVRIVSLLAHFLFLDNCYHVKGKSQRTESAVRLEGHKVMELLVIGCHDKNMCVLYWPLLFIFSF